ncbi:MAG TPA: hypothetical protein VGI39_15220, partial [Polyangiaceae bacterium]
MARTPAALVFALLAPAAFAGGCSAAKPPPASAPLAPARGTEPHATNDEERCAAGDGPACFAAGMALRAKRTNAKTGARAEQLLERGCGAGVEDSCAEAGRTLGWGMGVVPEAKKAAGMLDDACRAGSHLGCALFGEMLRQGVGVPKDLERAERLLDEACDGGNAQGCNDLALLISDKEGAQAEDIRALFSKACDGGFAYGCRNVTLYDKTLSEGAILALLERACSGEAPMACTDLGTRSMEGKGVPVDYATAARKFERACDQGDAAGCEWLGSLASTGRGIPKDPARAAQLYGRACDEGRKAACASLAWLFASGEGVSADEGHARELYARACRAHEDSGCRGLSRWRPAKKGVDPEGIVLLERLCKQENVVEACTARATYGSVHPGAPADERARGLDAAGTGCSLGSAEACVSAHKMRAAMKLSVDPKLLERACAADAKLGCALLAEGLRDGTAGRRDPHAALEAATKSCDAGPARGCVTEASLLDRPGAPAADLSKAASLRQRACDGGWPSACRDLAKMVRSGRGVARDGERAD